MQNGNGLLNKVDTNQESYFQRLRRIDVGEYIEKKNGLSYLSWAYAVDLLFQNDPDANYEFLEPTVFPDGSMLIWCQLTAFGKTTKQFLPVMDFKNKAITNPNAMDINKAMQRCLAKAIAVGTGLGLYVYRGEDLPVEDAVAKISNQQVENLRKFVKTETNPNGLVSGNDVKQLLGNYGIAKFAQLPEDKYDNFLNDIKLLIPTVENNVKTENEVKSVTDSVEKSGGLIDKETIAKLRQLKDAENWDVNKIKEVLSKFEIKPTKFDNIPVEKYEEILSELMKLKNTKLIVED